VPLKLIPPKPGRSPNYVIRGTHLGVRVYRSAGTPTRAIADALRKQIQRDIECGALRRGGKTFAGAVVVYRNDGGSDRYIRPLLVHFREALVDTIDQDAIDKAAIKLYPHASPSTRNRQVYTPMSAILRRAGIVMLLKRPRGSAGTPRTRWLRYDEAMRLLDASAEIDQYFAALIAFLLYTGCRLNEALNLRPADINLAAGIAYVGKTKNGEARDVHLPPHIVADLANLEMNDGQHIFRSVKCPSLYDKLDRAAKIAGVELSVGEAFHVFRHTWGKWMRTYGGLDTSGLVATKAWKSRNAAARYEHVDISEEAKKADLLPRAKSVR
jgi:integrase